MYTSYVRRRDRGQRLENPHRAKDQSDCMIRYSLYHFERRLVVFVIFSRKKFKFNTQDCQDIHLNKIFHQGPVDVH